MTLNVLIIEDNRFINKLFRISFSQQNCKTQEAFNGEQGWEKILPFRPDIIVIDIVMPKMDGISLLKKIQATYPNIFVAIVSNLDKETFQQYSETLKDIPYFKKSNTDPREITKQILNMHKQYSLKRNNFQDNNL